MAPLSTPTLGRMNGSENEFSESHSRIETSTEKKRTLVQHPERRVKRAIIVLEEQGFAVQLIDGNVVSAAITSPSGILEAELSHEPEQKKKRGNGHGPFDECYCLLLRPKLL